MAKVLHWDALIATALALLVTTLALAPAQVAHARENLRAVVAGDPGGAFGGDPNDGSDGDPNDGEDGDPGDGDGVQGASGDRRDGDERSLYVLLRGMAVRLLHFVAAGTWW